MVTSSSDIFAIRVKVIKSCTHPILTIYTICIDLCPYPLTDEVMYVFNHVNFMHQKCMYCASNMNNKII